MIEEFSLAKYFYFYKNVKILILFKILINLTLCFKIDIFLFIQKAVQQLILFCSTTIGIKS